MIHKNCCHPEQSEGSRMVTLGVLFTGFFVAAPARLAAMPFPGLLRAALRAGAKQARKRQSRQGVSEGSRMATLGVLFTGSFVASLLRMTGGRECRRPRNTRKATQTDHPISIRQRQSRKLQSYLFLLRKGTTASIRQDIIAILDLLNSNTETPTVRLYKANKGSQKIIFCYFWRNFDAAVYFKFFSHVYLP